MKRLEILKRLSASGFILKEGGNHTKVYDPHGNYVSAIGRHKEIAESIVRNIEKQTGIKLRG